MRALGLALALIALSATAAHAYPQFQLSTGAARCNQCHVGPVGGTLLSGYGRDEAGDTISRGGDGAFLHGLVELPDWLQAGGDIRYAGLVNDNGGQYSPSLVVFPMQADLYLGLRFGSFQVVLAGGAWGTSRGGQNTPLAKYWSREHYLMWRPRTQGFYVRAGRFALPYGLRFAEHPSYPRRFGGENLNEEPYALSGGYVDDDLEWHLTLHVKNPERCTGLGCATFGGAGFVEKRFDDNRWLFGVGARIAHYDDEVGGADTQHLGAYGKYWWEDKQLLFFAQLEGGLRLLRAANWTNREVIGQAGATWWPSKGIMLSLAEELYAEDVAVTGTIRNAQTLELQWFPWAHIEVVGYARNASEARLVMLQLHYYL
jgi:hypothetical protein